jgi:4-hydroxybenzoate polyprenyltransferase
MSRIKFIGNWIVALGTAFTLVFGASLLNNYFIVSILALSALLANVAREIIKDAEDMDADRGIKLSLPMLLGKGAIKAIVLLLHLLAIIIAFFAFFALKFGNTIFFVLMFVAAGIFLYSSKQFFSNNFAEAQNFSKIGMLVALIAFLAGVV